MSNRPFWAPCRQPRLRVERLCVPLLALPHPRGSVRLVATHAETGEEHCEVNRDNIVCEGLQEHIVHLLAGDEVASRHIDRIGWGTDGTPEQESDTSIVGLAVAKSAVASYPAARAVRFTATLAATEGNGTAVQEALLLIASASPQLAARVTFPVITKSSLFTWTWEWTLTFPVSSDGGTLNALLDKVCLLLAGEEAGNTLTYVQWGLSTIPEEQTQTALQSPISPLSPIDSYLTLYPQDNIVQVTASLGASYAVGMPIGEVGLLTGDSTCVARKTMTPVTKPDDRIWVSMWGVQAG